MVEIQAGTDRQRVGGRQIWGRSTGKAETGLRHTVQRRVSVGKQCDWIKDRSTQRTLGVSEGLRVTQL